MSSTKTILEVYAEKKLAKLNALLKRVDTQNKHVVLSRFSNKASFNGKHFCLDCGKRLKTHGAKRCTSCNMRLVGRNHIETRKIKEANSC